MEKVALIMAGGRGERFWPKSRSKVPKQFLQLTGEEKSILQLTVERIESYIEPKNIYISTNVDYREITHMQLPQIADENILCEPTARNTAACIGLAAIHIKSKLNDAVMFVLPSDHLIKNKAAFLGALQMAHDVAMDNDNLVAVGITPNRPDTGYGYLKIDGQSFSRGAFRVEGFYEKPNYETAQKYVASDQFLWNSGIFIWKVSSILTNIEEHMPTTYRGLKRIQATIGTETYDAVLNHEYSSFRSVSIDYGVMEKAQHLFSVPGSFYWDDVGSWQALDRINVKDENGNVTFGDFVTVNTRNCILSGHDKLITVIGASQLIIVDTEDAMLICHKDNVGEIKDVLSLLQSSGRKEYL